jgi:hypothetical protein
MVSPNTAPTPAVTTIVVTATIKPPHFCPAAPVFATARPTFFTWPTIVRAISLGLVAWLTASCALLRSEAPPTPIPAGSCTLALAPTAGDEAAISAVVSAEGELVVKQDITALMQLWGEGAFIANAKNTPTNQDDDQLWLDKDAIRHRYVRTVFPGAPTSASPKDLIIAIDGATAIVTATTNIGNELSPAGDRWELTKANGCWLIHSLTYNLESP